MQSQKSLSCPNSHYCQMDWKRNKSIHQLNNLKTCFFICKSLKTLLWRGINIRTYELIYKVPLLLRHNITGILQETVNRKNWVIILHPSCMSVHKFLRAESWKHNDDVCRAKNRTNKSPGDAHVRLARSTRGKYKQNKTFKKLKKFLRTNASAVNRQTGALNFNACGLSTRRLQRMCWKAHRQKIIQELQPAANREPSFSKD